MNPLILLPIVVCVLTSCTLSDVQSKASGGTRPADSMTVSRNAELQDTPRVTDPTLVATILRDAYSEERLAEDIYTKMVARYPQFTEVMNIINSEEKHSLQVGRLLDARGITRPTDYGSYSGTYDTLSKMVDSSLSGAIEAGVMIETGDINHLVEEYRKIEDTDVRQVFENIGGGSFNHLRAYLRLAQDNRYSVTTDYSRYMTTDEIKSTGPLKFKMTVLLKANNLPTYGKNMGMGNGQGNRTMENGTEESSGMMQQNGDGHGRGMNR